MSLRIHAILTQSEVNGPGKRLVIWTQGCLKGCKGCFNPETWTAFGGSNWEPGALADFVRERHTSENFEGITLTGGDPLEQALGIRDFLLYLHAEDQDLSWLPGGIICFTGFTVEEIDAMSGAEAEAIRESIALMDLLIDGRFIERLKIVDRLAGSSNQRFHFSSKPGRGMSRIKSASIEVDQGVEIHVTSSDDIYEVTGFPAIDRKWLKARGIQIQQTGSLSAPCDFLEKEVS